MVRLKSRRWFRAAVIPLLIAVVACTTNGSKSSGSAQSDAVATDVDISGPFLQNLTQDPHSADSAIRCGEPWIAQDALHPDTLYTTCLHGWGLNYQDPAPGASLTFSHVDLTKAAAMRPCPTFVSHDGGNSWSEVKPSPYTDAEADVCGDPMVVSGPHGELYIAADAIHYPADGKLGPVYLFGNGKASKDQPPEEPLGISFRRSLDGGKTWSKMTIIPTANDRPQIVVDQSTGVIYEASGCIHYDLQTKIGQFGCTPGSRNLAVSTDQGRTWTPSPTADSTQTSTTTLTQGHLHNIAPASVSGMAAALGVLALAGTSRGEDEEATSGSAGSGGGVSFKYSTDNGATFTQREIPIGDTPACAPDVGGLAGDPTRRGTFAVVIACPPNVAVLRVFVTHDFGASWKESADLAYVPPADYHGNPSPFGINRPWIAYGPSGALGVMWRETYGRGPFRTFGVAQGGPTDVFTALSADGGDTFGEPIRINTMASPAADPRVSYADDESYLILDRHFAYVVWGDWRSGELETWLRKVPIPPKG